MLCFHKLKADSLCDELCLSSFDFLTFCRWRGHTLPMAWHVFMPHFLLSLYILQVVGF